MGVFFLFCCYKVFFDKKDKLVVNNQGVWLCKSGYNEWDLIWYIYCKDESWYKNAQKQTSSWRAGEVLGNIFCLNSIPDELFAFEAMSKMLENSFKSLIEMKEKIFKIRKEDIKRVIEHSGACYASDKITVEGLLVKYMYREEKDFEKDSGWRFLSGTESQEYLANADNLMIYDVNTIANYDHAIIPYLNASVGSEFIRESGDSFRQL